MNRMTGMTGDDTEDRNDQNDRNDWDDRDYMNDRDDGMKPQNIQSILAFCWCRNMDEYVCMYVYNIKIKCPVKTGK